jgi:hypothetical protein
MSAFAPTIQLVVRERRNCFRVLKLRRTQNQPLGLEDGK